MMKEQNNNLIVETVNLQLPGYASEIAMGNLKFYSTAKFTKRQIKNMKRAFGWDVRNLED